MSTGGVILVALAIACEMQVAAPVMKKALAGFTGVKRRFTKTGEAAGVIQPAR